MTASTINPVSFDDINVLLNDFRHEMIKEFHRGKCLIIDIPITMLSEELNKTLCQNGEVMDFYPISDNETLVVTSYRDEASFKADASTAESKQLVDMGVQVINEKTLQVGVTLTNVFASIFMAVYRRKRDEVIGKESA